VHLVFVEEGAARPWLYRACEVAGAYEKLENCIQVRPSVPNVKIMKLPVMKLSRGCREAAATPGARAAPC